MRYLQLILLIFILTGCMAKEKTQSPARAEAKLPKSGSYLKDESKMPADFSINYSYTKGAFPEALGYTVFIKADGKGYINSDGMEKPIALDPKEVERVFLMMVDKKIFTIGPKNLNLIEDFSGPLFGIGGPRAKLRVQANRIITEFPSIPPKINREKIDTERVLKIKGRPETITQEVLGGAVEEAENLSSIFEAIKALVPND